MTDETITPAVEARWQDDPRWRLVSYDEEWWAAKVGPDAPVPQAPTDAAELANPDLWASLYDERKLVATWVRDLSTPAHPVTALSSGT